MHILALEPYDGGSHRAFLQGWSSRSRHHWQILRLPAHKWKWRMRHAPITLSQEVHRLDADGQRWDLIFCSDMLNLAEFLGLCPPALAALPRVVYFHENQLTYPVRHADERDYHYTLSNLAAALAADAVWFNSAYHRDDWLGHLPAFLRQMPDYQPLEVIEIIRNRSVVHPPGIEPPIPPRRPRRPGPLRILWAARWEHDKNPELFFEALYRLIKAGVDFRCSVLGEQFRESPAVFTDARMMLVERIDRWGYLPDRAAYLAALADADVVVSTALHEFFGLSVVEAIAAGAYPLLPDRLAYPEVLRELAGSEAPRYLYDGRLESLVERLTLLAGDPSLLADADDLPRRAAERYGWDPLAVRYDDALERVIRSA